MTLHLNKFIDRVQGHESRGAKDFVMTMADAKNLHADLTRLLIEIHTLQEQVVALPKEEVITVKMSGGSF